MTFIRRRNRRRSEHGPSLERLEERVVLSAGSMIREFAPISYHNSIIRAFQRDLGLLDRVDDVLDGNPRRIGQIDPARIEDAIARLEVQRDRLEAHQDALEGFVEDASADYRETLAEETRSTLARADARIDAIEERLLALQDGSARSTPLRVSAIDRLESRRAQILDETQARVNRFRESFNAQERAISAFGTTSSRRIDVILARLQDGVDRGEELLDEVDAILESGTAEPDPIHFYTINR